MKSNSLTSSNTCELMVIQVNKIGIILLYLYVKGRSIKYYSSECFGKLVDSGVLWKVGNELYLLTNVIQTPWE